MFCIEENQTRKVAGIFFNVFIPLNEYSTRCILHSQLKEVKKIPLYLLEYGPEADYFVALNIKNKRNNNVILKWKEDDVSMQREVAKNSTKNVDIKFTKNFYPDPVTFSATDQQTGKTIKMRDRDSLMVIPRKARTVEKVVLGLLCSYIFRVFDKVWGLLKLADFVSKVVNMQEKRESMWSRRDSGLLEGLTTKILWVFSHCHSTCVKPSSNEILIISRTLPLN